jgi:hypothetical protein
MAINKRKPGGGRKPAPGRKVNRARSFYLFEDQVERVTPEEVRAAVDAVLSSQETIIIECKV